MKRLLALITGILLFATILKGQSPVKPFVIPELTEWTASQGTSTLSGRVIVRSSQLAIQLTYRQTTYTNQRQTKKWRYNS